MSRVENMLAAKSHKSSQGPLQAPPEVDDHTGNALDQSQSTSASLIMPWVHSSSEESDADLETSFNIDAAKEIQKLNLQPDKKMICK